MQPAVNSEPHSDGLPIPQRYLAIGLLLIGLVIVVLDGAIANLALASIATSFGASAADTVWVVSSYQIAVLVALLPCGGLGEKFGPRRVYLAGVALFVLASAGCAFAVSLPMLVGARFLQGLGGGAVMALAAMNLRFAVPRQLLGTIIGINAMTVAIASAAGPGIAGAILSFASWHWLFAVNLPIGALMLAAGGVLADPQGVARQIDWRSIAANGLMFILLFLGIERLANAPLIGLLLIAGAIMCLVALLRLERNSAAPMLAVDLLADPTFRIAFIASIFCFSGQMLSYVALPFYLQHSLGLSPLEAGLYIMPWPAAVIVVAPISGLLADRISTSWLCTAGGALLALGLALIAVSSFAGGTMAFIAGIILAGTGFGLFQTPNNRILLLSAPLSRSGAAGAMQGTARLVGQTIGAIAMSIIFSVWPVLTAPLLALVIAAGCAAIAGLVSFSRVRYERAT